MKRRIALKQIGVGLSAGVLAPQFFTSCKKDDPGPEVPYNGNVVVIGAGAAGLYAADILRSKGIAVTVLEAGSQPGGRVRSLRNQTESQYQTFGNDSQADFPVELGSEIIYGLNSSWGKITTDLRISTVDLGESSKPSYVLSNQAKPGTDWQSDADFNAVQNFINGLPSYSGGGTIQSAANVSSRAQALLNSQGSNFYGSSSDKIGASGIAESLKAITHDTKQLTMRSNPQQDVLLSRFVQVLPNVKLNTVVKSIDWSGDIIKITDANGGQTTATKIIIAVPLSILKNGGITFNPPLPGSTTSAIANFGMDSSIRLIMDFKKNFWGIDTSYIWGGSTVPQYFNAGAGRSQFYRTLSITINGPKADQLSALKKESEKDEQNYAAMLQVLAELDAVYAGQGTQFVRRDLNNTDNSKNILHLVKDWKRDQFIKGSNSYPLVGATNQHRKDMATPLSNKLYFAGEATDATGDAGTVSGALNSAFRVSEEVVKSITGA